MQTDAEGRGFLEEGGVPGALLGVVSGLGVRDSKKDSIFHSILPLQPYL